jgi:exonuclease VII small subunit
MKVQSLAWMCIGIILVFLIGGPAVFAVWQENQQLTAMLHQTAQDHAALNDALHRAQRERDAFVSQQVKRACQPLREEVAALRQGQDALESELARWEDLVRFEQEKRQELQETEKQMEQLRAEATGLDGESEVEIRRYLVEVTTRSEQIERRLDELADPASQSIDSTFTEIQSAWDQLAQLLAKTPPESFIATKLARSNADVDQTPVSANSPPGSRPSSR